jgi:hypothetical protein
MLWGLSFAAVPLFLFSPGMYITGIQTNKNVSPGATNIFDIKTPILPLKTAKSKLAFFIKTYFRGK